MVTKADIEMINEITEEKRQFLNQDWHGINPAVKHMLRVHGQFDKAEIKDCIGFYILTNVDKDILDMEFEKLKRFKR